MPFLSSRYEGLPAVLVEARVAGLPLIATDCSTSMADLLARPCDRIVPVGDVAALGEAIRDFRPSTSVPDLPDLRWRFRVEDVAGRYAAVFEALRIPAPRSAQVRGLQFPGRRVELRPKGR